MLSVSEVWKTRDFLIQAKRFNHLAIHVAHDQSPDTPVVSRLFQVEAAHHRALIQPAARLAEPALHERWHEPVRADFFGQTKMPIHSTARRGHPKMHSRRRQA